MSKFGSSGSSVGDNLPYIPPPSLLKPIAPTEKSSQAVKYAGLEERRRIANSLNHNNTILSRSYETGEKRKTLG